MQRYVTLFLCLILKTFSHAQAPVSNIGSTARDSATFANVSIKLAGLNGRATKAQLLEIGGLYMTSSGVAPKCTVEGYMFGYVLSDNSVVLLKVNGPGFTDQIKNVIRSLPSDSKVFFNDIKIAAPDGRVRSLNPISLIVE